jgi:antitoxin CptB
MLSAENRVKRLRWKARRGMKELDVLLETFFAQQTAAILAGDWPQLELFLSQEDDVLFDWISGRDLPDDPSMLLLINTLTHAT